jgi:hypothetical protein
MRVLFTTDLHGSRWKYDRLFEVAEEFQANVVINGGDMLPKNNEPFRQGEFITDYLDNHFARFNSAGIYYLCYLINCLRRPAISIPTYSAWHNANLRSEVTNS